MKKKLTNGIQALKELLRKIRNPQFAVRNLAAPLACAVALACASSASAQVVDQSFTNLSAQSSFTYQTPGFITQSAITNGFPTNASSTTGQVYLLPGTNVTVSTGMVNTLSSNAVIDVRHFDEVTISVNFQLYNPNGAAPSSGGTNVYVWGASEDGVHFSDTNKPLFSISVSPTVGQSNACIVTNIPRTLLGSHGYIQLQQIQNLSTNGITNHSISVWGKQQRAGILTPVF